MMLILKIGRLDFVEFLGQGRHDWGSRSTWGLMPRRAEQRSKFRAKLRGFAQI
jgi:hypothetical protein